MSVLVEYVIPSAQLLVLALMFCGLVLLSGTVREVLASAYTRLYLRRLTLSAESEGRRLALSICRTFYLTRRNEVSALKTFLLASVSFAIVALPLARMRLWYGSAYDPTYPGTFNFMSVIWDGSRPDVSAMPDIPAIARTMSLESINVAWALPFTLIYHWLWEFAAGYVFVRLALTSGKHYFARVAVGMLAFFGLMALTPLLSQYLVTTLLTMDSYRSWRGLFAAHAVSATGPGIVLGPLLASSGVLGGSRPPWLFALALLSSMTFAGGLLSILLAYAATRTRLAVGVMASLARRGRLGAITLVSVSVVAFGLLADFSASAAAIAKLGRWLS
jgi:hypothetical protein